MAFTEQCGAAKEGRNTWNNYEDTTNNIVRSKGAITGIWAQDVEPDGNRNRGNLFVHRGIAENSNANKTTSTAAYTDPTAIGPNKVINPSGTTANPNYYPSSNHGGGVVVGYADGHTAILKETVSNLVYTQLMTSNGPNSRFVGQNELDRLPMLDEGDLAR